MRQTDDVAPSARSEHRESDLGPLPSWFSPIVDWVARWKTTVHAKLLFGFLTISLLLVALGMLSIGVLSRIDGQVDRLTTLHDQSDRAREMIYAVTGQSHFRAMALITEIDSWDDKIYAAKDNFVEDLAFVRSVGGPRGEAFFGGLTATNDRFRDESEVVTALYYDGALAEALDLHIQVEHETSHELEDDLNAFIADLDHEAALETASFESNRRLLTFAVASFSGASLVVALLLGAVLSWSLIRPVRRVDRALHRMADGDFDQRVEVPNRDEFGSLTANLNRTAQELDSLYTDLETLNNDLQDTVDRKVQELSRAARLRRYVSPQLAESILSGDTEIAVSSSRKHLTVFLSDIRGFTEIAERMEPEHLVEELNEYLSAMTEIVFRHGGTLDKYIGDAILVFFGDPIEQPDQAQRAVRMALEMQAKVAEFHGRWKATYGESFTIGIGITTGWVTVGNIGSSARSDYTVLGNEVNLSSRLADRAEPGQILVSERTMEAAGSVAHGEVVDEVSLKGVSRPIQIYSVTAPEGTAGSA